MLYPTDGEPTWTDRFLMISGAIVGWLVIFGFCLAAWVLLDHYSAQDAIIDCRAGNLAACDYLEEV